MPSFPIVIAGPTASGKSSLALRLARELKNQNQKCEIISADSVAVFRGFDIGSAKPSKVEQAEFPHHLLDVAGAGENFTAGDFVRLAIPAIEAIQSRGATPLLVGGTGFYLRALLRGMASNETEDAERAAELKLKLTARAAAEGWDALYSELLRLDPGSAGAVHLNDHYRVLRALQAMELYGRPWSELNKEARATDFRFPGTRFFAMDVEREELKARIAKRSEQMLEDGLLAETKNLFSQFPGAKALLSVGYKECVDTIKGTEPEATLAARITQATNKLAKGQRTWFRGEQGVEFLAPDFWENLRAALRI